MRKITTKFMAASMAAMMAVSMAGCSASVTTSKVEEATTEAGSDITVKVTEVTEDEMVSETGIDLPKPEGAKNAVYSIVDEGDLRISQLSFTLDDHEMFLRACETSETSLNASGEESEADTEESDSIEDDIDEITATLRTGDISGLDYDWNLDMTTTVSDREANVHVTTDGVGYIAWLDTVPGILYNLCMEKDASTDNLVEYAEKVFVPLQGESDGDELTDAGTDFDSLVEEIYETKAGSAGSSSRVEAAATSLINYVQTYADVITLQNMEALASEKLDAMSEEYGEDFADNFQECLDAVSEAALSENPDYETDVTYGQVVNGIQMVLDDMK